MTMPNGRTAEEASLEHMPIASTASASAPAVSATEQSRHHSVTSSYHPQRKYRGGFHSSICDIFRDPHRQTDCCAVACCGVLSSDRSRYLLTGQLPPPLWLRALMYLIVPALFIAAMNYFTVDIPAEEEGQTQKAIRAEIFWPFIAYIIILAAYSFIRNKKFRKEVMKKLHEERARERGEEVNPTELSMFINRHYLDISRAHSCCSICYRRDYDFIDETGMIDRVDHESDDELDKDICTCLWNCLSKAFWCCGCWCQCCGICALAQEEREVNRLTGHMQHKIDYLTFQPYSEYYPAIKYLRDNQIRSPWKHFSSISKLSKTLLKNVVAVLLVLLIFALSNIDSNFTWENMIVVFLTLGQAFFIEWLVHWMWNLFDLSFDAVVKYFACGFLLITPLAVIFEVVVSTLSSIIVLVAATFVIAADSELANELTTDPEAGMKHLMVNHPGLFIFIQFVNAYCVAALVEEMVKYFGYRMVVTPDLVPGGNHATTQTINSDGNEAEAVNENPKSLKSVGAGITVAMVSVALGFACCENLIYIFVYSPPSLDIEVATLFARSMFPVHPLCAAIQSIGVCRRDLEKDKRFGLGRIIFPAILLHGTFDFVLMLAAYFQQRDAIKEGNDNEGEAAQDDDASEDFASQLPSLIIGLMLVITGYNYYVVQSRAQNRRLIALDTDNASAEQSSSLV